MIEMRIRGRLGNQMFQYAALRGYMERYHDADLRLSFQSGVYQQGFQNDLEQFNIIKYEENDTIELSLKQKLLTKYISFVENRIDANSTNNKNERKHQFELKNMRLLMKNGIYLMGQGYVDFEPCHAKNKLFIGNFESAKYFNHIRPLLLEEFTPKYEKLERNLELYHKIENSESVCISIRRGDFLSKENIQAHYVCTEEYFYKAIQEINNRVKNPHYFVFSDDVEWVRNNMTFPEGTDFETGTDPVWEKLRLMYECKHFIISNSTFSWWAQYLSRNDNKVVIAPTIWKNNYQNNDIYEEKWILIEP